MTIHPNLQNLLNKLEKIKELTQLHTDTGKELHGLILDVSSDLDKFAGNEEEQKPQPAPKIGCSHPHFEDVSPGSNLIVKRCLTCAELKYNV